MSTVSAGMVDFTSRKRVIDELGTGAPGHYASMGLGYGTGIHIDDGPAWTYKDVKERKLVFDVFTLDPFACYRFSEDKIDFRGSPQARTQSARLNFRHMISDFAACGGEVPANEGVRLVAVEAAMMEWKHLTFSSIANFDRYNYWRLQLEQYG